MSPKTGLGWVKVFRSGSEPNYFFLDFESNLDSLSLKKVDLDPKTRGGTGVTPIKSWIYSL